MALPSILVALLPIRSSMVRSTDVGFPDVLNLMHPFADTFSSPVLLNPSGGNLSSEIYQFSSSGIAWPGEAKKYASAPGYNNMSLIVPPPNWRERFPFGYTAEDPPPNLHNDEHFQNWMRTAGLPTFTKLYGRNDTQNMSKGTYRLIIGLSVL